MIIDLFLVALLSLVCLVLTDSSSLVTRLTEECHRSDGERSLEWQTPAVAYPFGSLHDLCVAVVVVLLDEVVRHFRQDLSILLIICHRYHLDSRSVHWCTRILIDMDNRGLGHTVRPHS